MEIRTYLHKQFVAAVLTEVLKVLDKDNYSNTVSFGISKDYPLGWQPILSIFFITNLALPVDM